MENKNRRWAPDYVDQNTRVIVSNLEKDLWKVSISAKDVSKEWDDQDDFYLSDFCNYESCERGNGGEVLLYLNTKEYQMGSMIILLFYNETRDEAKSVYVNFSDGDDIITGSKEYREYLKKNLQVEDRNIECVSSEKKEKEIVSEEPISQGVRSELNLSTENPAAADHADSLRQASNVSWSTTTTENTFFVIYNASGNVAAEYLSLSTKSPFEAIHRIVKDDKINYTVRESTNTSKVVFKYEPTVKTKFYCFQFTNFYGCVGVDDVQTWTRGYWYTHVVRSDGYFGSNTDDINGTATNQPYSHSYVYQLDAPSEGNLEGGTGAYVYKISKTTSKTKATMIVNLSEATLHYSEDVVTTFYSYINVTSNDGGWFTCDIGLAMSKDAGGDMQISVNPQGDSSCTTIWAESSDPPISEGDAHTIAQFDSSEGDTTFTANQDIKLYVEVTNGCFHGKAYNYTTAKTIDVFVYSSKIRTTNLTFMNAVSLVPNTVKGPQEQHIISDIRCGAYARNIPILYPRLYTSSQSWDGNGTEFAPNDSSVTKTFLIYDNDHAEHTYTQSQRREVITIDYTNTYRR